MSLLLAFGCDRAGRQSGPAAESSQQAPASPVVTAEPTTSAPVAAPASSPAVATGSPSAAERSPVQVVEEYYRDIAARDFASAYRAWGEGGQPGRSLEEFSAGFRDTASVSVTTGPPSPVGAAAGSRYVTVPVTVSATLKSGGRQRFRGTYVLRRSVVDGATPAQRSWHIDRATLDEVR